MYVCLVQRFTAFGDPSPLVRGERASVDVLRSLGFPLGADRRPGFKGGVCKVWVGRVSGRLCPPRSSECCEDGARIGAGDNRLLLTHTHTHTHYILNTHTRTHDE